MVLEAAFIEATNLYPQMKAGLYEMKTWVCFLYERLDRSVTDHSSSMCSYVHYKKLIKFRRYFKE